MGKVFPEQVGMPLEDIEHASCWNLFVLTCQKIIYQVSQEVLMIVGHRKVREFMSPLRVAPLNVLDKSLHFIDSGFLWLSFEYLWQWYIPKGHSFHQTSPVMIVWSFWYLSAPNLIREELGSKTSSSTWMSSWCCSWRVRMFSCKAWIELWKISIALLRLHCHHFRCF